MTTTHRPVSTATTTGPRPHIAALTGLRGVAILIVICGHLGNARFEHPSVGYWLTLPLQHADVGVSIFFVLSGYLITGILIREKTRTGRVNLRAFYARRAYRIWPALYVFLAAVAALAATGVVTVGWKDIATSALYTANYVAPESPWLTHTWSLAVEEQFYLLWPLVLIFTSTRWAWRIALTVIVVAPLWRAYRYLNDGVLELSRFEYRVDSMLAGAALALAVALYPTVVDAARRVVCRWHLVPAAVLGMLATVVAKRHAKGMSWWVLETTVAAGATVVIILAATATTGWTMRVLQTRLLVWTGLISFSLYLWQQLFTMGESRVPAWAGIPAMLVLATASYLCVEKPFLRLKDRRA